MSDSHDEWRAVQAVAVTPDGATWLDEHGVWWRWNGAMWETRLPDGTKLHRTRWWRAP